MSEADAEPVEISSAGPPKSRDPRALNPEAGNEAASMGVEVGDGDQFQLTPDRLSTISELNVELEKIVAQLASMPVFTAAVGTVFVAAFTGGVLTPRGVLAGESTRWRSLFLAAASLRAFWV